MQARSAAAAVRKTLTPRLECETIQTVKTAFDDIMIQAFLRTALDPNSKIEGAVRGRSLTNAMRQTVNTSPFVNNMMHRQMMNVRDAIVGHMRSQT